MVRIRKKEISNKNVPLTYYVPNRTKKNQSVPNIPKPLIASLNTLESYKNVK